MGKQISNFMQQECFPIGSVPPDLVPLVVGGWRGVYVAGQGCVWQGMCVMGVCSRGHVCGRRGECACWDTGSPGPVDRRP